MQTTDGNGTRITIYETPRTVKPRALRVVPSPSQVAHEAVCSIDGEPWPCRHFLRRANFAYSQRYSVRCKACGQLRNEWHSLEIEAAFDGQAVYFHARKRCRPAAERWWNENVLPLINEPFREWQTIDNLLRYVGARQRPTIKA